MRKALLFVTTLLFVLQSQAQYLEFPDSGAVWKINNKYYGTGSPNNSSVYYSKGDTNINGKRYIRLGARTGGYDVVCGFTTTYDANDRFIRTDTTNGKVYEWEGDIDVFHLDYNVSVGEKMRAGLDTNTHNTVDSIFTAFILGKQRRIWRYNEYGANSRFMVEGIGSADGIFVSSPNEMFSFFEWSSTMSFCLNGVSFNPRTLEEGNSPTFCSVPQVPVAPPCTVSFSILPDPLLPGVYIGTHSMPNTFLSFFLWDFGDGTTSNLQYPTHQYSSPGFYKVCLTYGVSVPPQCNPYASCTYCDSSFYVFKTEGGPMSSLIFSDPVGLNEIEDNSVVIYPNPANDKFTFSVNDAILESEIYISDIRGRVLHSATISSLEQEFSLASFSNGVYFVTIRKNGASYVKRLVVSK